LIRLQGPTILHATAVSDAVLRVLQDGPWLGTIDGVFRRAVNVAAPAAPGRLIAILDDDLGLPYGITCSARGPGGISGLGLAAGMTVLVDAHGIHVPAAGARIGIDAATRIHPVALIPMPWGSPGAVAARARLARSLVMEGPPGAGLAPLLDPGAPRSAFAARVEAALASVTAALVAGEMAVAAREGRALVGLGVGLTPSGDDALVGMTAALAATGHPSARVIARAWAVGAAERTTTVGAALLAHAARLEFAGVLRAVLGAILRGDKSEVRRTVPAALSWGATSGADTLVGVLAGLEVVLEPSRRTEAVA
jgi:hypothetical protein